MFIYVDFYRALDVLFYFAKWILMEVAHISNLRKPDEMVNESIKLKEMLVITDKGEKLGLLPKNRALEEAYKRGLDLVVVSAESNPAVAKMMDYSKFRFEQQKKLKEMKKKQKVVTVQEIQLSPTIEKHDFDTKARKAQTILDKGNKVKITLRLKGRMIVHQELAKEVIAKFVEALAETSTLESEIKLDGKLLFATIAPKKQKGDN